MRVLLVVDRESKIGQPALFSSLQNTVLVEYAGSSACCTISKLTYLLILCARRRDAHELRATQITTIRNSPFSLLSTPSLVPDSFVPGNP
jgi:hypothetical protein